MHEGFQYGDIIFLALIALFVVLRLRSTLGKNSGIDPRDVWKNAVRDTLEKEQTAVFPERLKKSPVEDLPPQVEAGTPVAEGLKAIRQLDSSFSTSDFLSGARMAFEWVVEAFAKGDKDKLKMLLSDERYQYFAADVDARARDGITQQTTIVSILSSDITEAAVQSAIAKITVQFTTEQIHVRRDKLGTVVEGDASSVEKVIDTWTFERNTAMRDPNWKITET